MLFSKGPFKIGSLLFKIPFLVYPFQKRCLILFNIKEIVNDCWFRNLCTCDVALINPDHLKEAFVNSVII